MTAQPPTDSSAAPALPTAPRVPDVVFRPFRDGSDYDALAELMSQSNRHDRVPELPTAANVRIDMENSALDPTVDVLLGEVGGRLIASTSVEHSVRDDLPVYVIDGYVRPDQRHRGLGAALLDWTIRRAQQRAAVEDPGREVFVQGDAQDQETGHRALLERAGFAPVRHFFGMRRPSLLGIPEVPLPEGIELRPVTVEQGRSILEAEFEAFRDHWGHREPTEESYRRTLESPELDTALWVVAWDGDQIAGVVENWVWPDENEKLGVRRGWLERISVRRPWRRRGLGRAITAAGLLRLRAAGMEEAMLGVDSQNPNGALGLYEGLGFEVHHRAAAYRRPLDSGS